jgi:cellobiose transport system permease protein
MTTVVYLYDLAWGDQHSLGRASAVAWMLFLLILVIGLVNFLVTRRISSSGTAVRKKPGHKSNPSKRTTGGNA